MKVHIGHHFYGAGNIGDDLMLAGFLQGLSNKAGDLRFTCCTPFDLKSQQRRFPQIEWLPYSSEARQAVIANSDCWLGLGDTPFQSDCGEWFIDHLADEATWCKKHQVPMWFLDVGVNNREVFDLPKTKFLLDCVEGIWTRDEASANCIADYFPRAKIRLGADLANIYLQHRTTKLDQTSPKASIGLCLHFEDKTMFDIPALEASILDDSDNNFAWLIQEVRILDFSEHRLFEMLSDQVKQRLELREPNYAQASVEELLDVWGCCEVALSSRYHSGLIQAWSGGKVVLVARNQKLLGLAEQLDCPIIESVVEKGSINRAIAIARKIDPQRLFALAKLAEDSVSDWLATAHNTSMHSTITPSVTNKDLELPATIPTQRYIVLSLDALGDLTLRQPFLSGLLDKGASVCIVTRPNCTELVPIIDQRLVHIETSLNPYVPSPIDTVMAELKKLLTLIQEWKPSCIICPLFNRTFIDEWLLRSIPEIKRFGFFSGSNQQSQLKTHFPALAQNLPLLHDEMFTNYVSVEKELHECDKLQYLFNKLVGQGSILPNPMLNLHESVNRNNSKLLGLMGLEAGQYAIVSSAANNSTPLKTITDDQAIALIKRLYFKHSIKSVLIGTPSQQADLDRVADNVNAIGAISTVRIGQPGSLIELLGLISTAKIYTGCDTGPMHFAAALGIPVLAIFGGGHFPRFLPRARHAQVLTQYLPCFGCDWSCAFDNSLCIKMVDTTNIEKALDTLLNDSPGNILNHGCPSVADPAYFLQQFALPAMRKKESVIQEKESVIQEKESVIQEKESVIQEQSKALEQYHQAFSLIRPILPVIRVMSRMLRRSISILRPRLGNLNQYAPRPIVLSPLSLNINQLTSTPKISIVTPSFQQGIYIDRTIKSVFNQQYPNLEYFVQDGGSNDNTVAILKSYDERLSWASEKDHGQSQAINLGFANTKGEIMAWLNSDDLLLPGAMATVADYFNKHPEVDVVYGNRLLIDENDMEIGRWILPGHDSNVLSWVDYIPQETLFWRRSIWDKVGGKIDESFRFAMDWDLLVRFRDAGARFAHIPRFLGAFRIHEQQKTSAAINEIGYQEMDRIRERLLGRIPTRNETRKRITFFILKHNVVDIIYRIKSRLKKCGN